MMKVLEFFLQTFGFTSKTKPYNRCSSFNFLFFLTFGLWLSILDKKTLTKLVLIFSHQTIFPLSFSEEFCFL